MRVSSVDEAAALRDVIGGAPGDELTTLILRTTSAGLVLAGPDGVVRWANEAARELLGAGRRLAGTNVDRFVRSRGGGGHATLRAAFVDEPSVRPLSGNAPLTARTLDGETVHLRIGLAPLDDGDVLVVLHDATDEVLHQERLEEDLRRHERVLAQLRELEARRTQLLAAVAHELRTPLTVVSGVAETLTTHAAALREEDRERLMSRMLDQARRLADLVEDVFAVVPGTVVASSPSVHRLDELVRDAVEKWRHRHPGTEVELTCEPTTAWVDERAVPRIVRELLDNAARHGAPPVHVSIVEASPWALLDVVDDGPGIPDALVTEAFAPLGRGHGGLDATPGLGLGLTLVRVLAEAVGGWFDQVTVDETTRFRVTFHASGPGEHVE